MIKSTPGTMFIDLQNVLHTEWCRAEYQRGQAKGEQIREGEMERECEWGREKPMSWWGMSAGFPPLALVFRVAKGRLQRPVHFVPANVILFLYQGKDFPGNTFDDEFGHICTLTLQWYKIRFYGPYQTNRLFLRYIWEDAPHSVWARNDLELWYSSKIF